MAQYRVPVSLRIDMMSEVSVEARNRAEARRKTLALEFDHDEVDCNAYKHLMRAVFVGTPRPSDLRELTGDNEEDK